MAESALGKTALQVYPGKRTSVGAVTVNSEDDGKSVVLRTWSPPWVPAKEQTCSGEIRVSDRDAGDLMHGLLLVITSDWVTPTAAEGIREELEQEMRAG